MPGKLHINLLGTFCLSYEGKQVDTVSSARQRELLAWLLLYRQASQSRQRMAFLLWPDSNDKQARANLRNLLHLLRNALPEAEHFLTVDAQTIQWNPESNYTLDVAEFEESVLKAREAEQQDDPLQQKEALTQAIDSYNGPLLPSCYTEWIEEPRERLRGSYSRALEELVGLLEARREYEIAIRHARKWIREDPYKEMAWRQLMQLYAKKGARADALNVYQECRQLLREELDINPAPETRQIYKQLLNSYTIHTGDQAPEPTLLVDEDWPLVGRVREWESIKTCWKSTLSGNTQFMLMKGDAGIGKSRLGLEFTGSLRRQGYAVAYSRCYEVPESLSYGPIVDWLQDPAVKHRIRALDPLWLTELVRLLPELLVDHPDLKHPGPVGDSLQQRQLLEAVSRGLTAGSTPMLLFLDDLQWCDRKTLEWISYVLHSHPSQHLMILGSCRPAEAESNRPLEKLMDDLRHLRQLREVSLGVLSERETMKLASLVAPKKIEGEPSRRLYQETEGHPLFIVEMVRAGYGDSEQVPAGEESELSFGSPPAAKNLPRKITEFISHRFKRLSRPAEKLMGLAAVIGRECAFELLRKASDLSEGDLLEQLEELVRYNILREQQSGVYDFTHDKLREVAYGELSDPRRQWLHKQVALAIEELEIGMPEERKSRLAYHCRQAGLPEQIPEQQKEDAKKTNLVVRPADPDIKREFGTGYVLRTLSIYALAGVGVYGIAAGLTSWLGLPGWTITAVIFLLVLGLPVTAATAIVEGWRRGPPSQDGETRLQEAASWLRETAGRWLRWSTVLKSNVLAFGGLALVVGGYMGSRSLGVGPFATLLSVGALEEEDKIVMADFETETIADSVLVFTVTEALRTDLAQSPVVNLADRARIATVLSLMELPSNAPLDFQTARELAIREGMKAVVAGQINALGSTFVLSTRLVSAESGRELVSLQETAESEDALIGAIERLSRKLRKRIGESLASVHASPRLIHYRTASLEALKLFSLGHRAIISRGDNERCIALMNKTLAVDSLFAAAYWYRGAAYGNMNSDPDKQVADFLRAFQLRDRMTDWGRTAVMQAYYRSVTGEFEKGIEVLESYRDLHPEDSVRTMIFQGIQHMQLGQYRRAEELYRRMIRAREILNPGDPLLMPMGNMRLVQILQGKFEDAEKTLDRLEEKGPDTWILIHGRADLAFARGEYPAAIDYVQEWRNRERESHWQQARTSWHLAFIALEQGKLSVAETHYRDAMRASEERSNLNGYLQNALRISTSHLRLASDTTRAREIVDSALARHPLDSMNALNREYQRLAITYAQLGKPEIARSLLEQALDSIPEYVHGRFEYEDSRARGWISVAEGRLQDAISHFEHLEERPTLQNQLDRLFALGLIHDRMDNAKTSIKHYEQLVNQPFKGWDRAGWYQPRSLERLGQLHEEQGNIQKAAEYYKRFIQLWEEADPQLQPRVEAVRETLQQLMEDSKETPEPVFEANSIAVLPLDNLSGDEQQEYFADGMTEALITEMGRISDLKVISRTSSMYYKDTNKRLPEIARELRVGRIVTGSVFREDERLRISVQLVDAATDHTLWTQNYQRNLRDVVTLQGQVAQAIANEVQITLAPEEQKRLTSVRPVNPEAYEDYLKGRYYAPRIGKNLKKAIQFYEDAIHKDPGFAKAYAALTIIGILTTDGELVERGIEAAYQAIELNPNLSESQTALGMAKMAQWEWTASEQAFQRAIELNPNSSMAHQWYAQLLRQTMRLDKALQEARIAEQLNPLSLMTKTMVGWVLFNQQRYNEALSVWDNVLEMEPEYGLALYNKGLAYLMRGEGEKVISMAHQASTAKLPLRQISTTWLEVIGYFLRGQQELADKLFEQYELKYAETNPSRIVVLYHVFGKDEEALNWLEKAYELRDTFLPNIMTEPIIDDLRDHPRFQKIMKQLNFPSN